MENTNTPFVCDDTRVVRVVRGRDKRKLDFDQIYMQANMQAKSIPHFDVMEFHEIFRRRLKDQIAECECEFLKAFDQVFDELQKNIGNYEERLKAFESLRDMLRIFLSFKSVIIEEIC